MPRTKLRGAIPSPRHVLAAATPHRIVGATPASWLWAPQKLSMWHNDQYGDCVTAMRAFFMACFGIFIDDQTVFSWAQQHGVLNGAVISNVLNQFVTDGFPQDGNTYCNGAPTSVDYTDMAVLANACAANPLAIGVAANQLEHAVNQGGDRTGWVGFGFTQDTSYDHNPGISGYGQFADLAQYFYQAYGVNVQQPNGMRSSTPCVSVFTWNSQGILDVASMLAITGEAWSNSPNPERTIGTFPPQPDRVWTPSAPTPGPTPVPTPTPTPTPGPTPRPGICAILDILIARAQASGHVLEARLFAMLASRLGCAAARSQLGMPNFQQIIEAVMAGCATVEEAIPKIEEILKILEGK